MKKGSKHSKETLEKISNSLTGRKGWNKGKKGVYSEDSKKKMSEAAKKRGSNHSKKYREKMSKKWEGEANPRFKPIGTKKEDGHGYILIKIATGKAHKNWEFEHIVVMEKNIKRKINKRIECVHHINHIKNDNRLENLQLLSIKDHKRLHVKDSILKNSAT